MKGAAREWRAALAAWTIPEDILAQAPQSPWIHPPALFVVVDDIVDSPSHQRAREVLENGGSVLDVGCGGGFAAFAVSPPATRVVGVDQQREMLEMFTRTAHRRSLDVATVEGSWPEVAPVTPRCDVVTAHHVVYNVGEIVPFLSALDSHATQRVVLELPRRHPLTGLSGAWEHFWGVSRPTSPTYEDLIAVLDDMGVASSCEVFEAPARSEIDLATRAHYERIRLCLPASREQEVLAYVSAHPPEASRDLVTLWWDR